MLGDTPKEHKKYKFGASKTLDTTKTEDNTIEEKTDSNTGKSEIHITDRFIMDTKAFEEMISPVLDGAERSFNRIRQYKLQRMNGFPIEEDPSVSCYILAQCYQNAYRKFLLDNPSFRRESIMFIVYVSTDIQNSDYWDFYARPIRLSDDDIYMLHHINDTLGDDEDEREDVWSRKLFKVVISHLLDDLSEFNILPYCSFRNVVYVWEDFEHYPVYGPNHYRTDSDGIVTFDPIY